MYWDEDDPAQWPVLVRSCVRRWRQLNPGWTVTVLTPATVGPHIEDPIDPTVSVQAFADVLRMTLLWRHGGVWTDASMLPLRPLDQWLIPEWPRDGGAWHAAFFGPGSGWYTAADATRFPVVENWWLAATPGHPLVGGVLRELRAHSGATSK